MRGRSDGHGFGVVTADVNDDGLVDIFVANDMNPNFLFLNKGDGTFDDVSEVSGAAFNINGMSQSGMGVDAEDVDGDGLPELLVTNFANEYSTLYHNYGKGIFYDNTAFFGLASDSMPWVKWGCALADFDDDGWPDIFIVNGHVDNNRRLIGQPVDYEEIPLLFRNQFGSGTKRFRLATRDAGEYFDTKHVGRGVAFGDVDNDGDIDIVVNHKDAAPALLRNDTKSQNHWIRFVLEGTKSNRDSIGAKVVVTAGGRDHRPAAEGRLQHAGHQRPPGAGGPGHRRHGHKGRGPLALRADDHPGKPEGRSRVQARRAQDRQRGEAGCQCGERQAVRTGTKGQSGREQGPGQAGPVIRSGGDRPPAGNNLARITNWIAEALRRGTARRRPGAIKRNARIGKSKGQQ